MTDDQLRDELHRVAGCQKHSQRSNRIVVMIQQLLAEERERCAQAAYLAKLPDGFHWGDDAMEQFDFGKERATVAVRALT